MIVAQHSWWAELLFNPYEKNLLKKNFSAFYLTRAVPEVNPDAGLLVTPNHFSWWDGFFIDFALKGFIQRKLYIIMLEEQLRKYKFFRRLGAFSIKPGNYSSIKKSLLYSTEILSSSKNMLIYYPQGNIEPYDISDISFKKGLFNIIEKSATSLQVMPAAFKIEYDNKKKPAVWFRPGSLISAEDIKINPDIYIKYFIDNLNALTSDVHRKNYQSELFGRIS